MTFSELQEFAPQADAVVAGVDDWNSSIFSLTPRLKAICRFGVGVDNINLEDASKANIKVTNAAGMNANAVAELTIGLLISAMRNIPQLYQTTQQGRRDRFVGDKLINRKVGLLGFGNIARCVAKKLMGFDVDVSAYDKYPNLEAARALNVTICDKEEILRTSDVVILLLPSLKETYHFMNDDAFSMMKPGSYFINTARGALVDEAALYRALTSGRLSGAAIDVYEAEPTQKGNPLFTLDNVITTPHTAAETYKTYHDIGLLTAQAILDVFNGREPKNLLN